MTQTIRDQLLKRGAANLREFGYPDAKPENVLSEMIFRMFLKSMLQDNLGKGGVRADDAINGLLKEIAEIEAREAKL